MNNEDWDWFDTNFKPLLNKAVLRNNGGKHLWYECYIDVEDTIDRWWNYIRSYPNLAAQSISLWMIKRDKWYWSPEYVDALNKATKKHGDAGTAFTEVLNASLK